MTYILQEQHQQYFIGKAEPNTRVQSTSGHVRELSPGFSGTGLLRAAAASVAWGGGQQQLPSPPLGSCLCTPPVPQPWDPVWGRGMGWVLVCSEVIEGSGASGRGPRPGRWWGWARGAGSCPPLTSRNPRGRDLPLIIFKYRFV